MMGTSAHSSATAGCIRTPSRLTVEVMVEPELSVVVTTVPLVPEVEFVPPVVELDPPMVELVPASPPPGAVEFEPEPPEVELEDERPVEPEPRVVVVPEPVATTTVLLPVVESVEVTVAVEAPEAEAATVPFQS